MSDEPDGVPPGYSVTSTAPWEIAPGVPVRGTRKGQVMAAIPVRNRVAIGGVDTWVEVTPDVLTLDVSPTSIDVTILGAVPPCLTALPAWIQVVTMDGREWWGRLRHAPQVTRTYDLPAMAVGLRVMTDERYTLHGYSGPSIPPWSLPRVPT